MLKIGLTGGIASGKSTVAAMLRELGFPVLDADTIAHTLIEPGQPAYEDIVREFGSDVLDAQNRIDRAKLGGIAFADRGKLDRLNAIVHPRVRDAMSRSLAELAREGKYRAAFVEAALLVETGFHLKLDGLVVVTANPDQQRERLSLRGLRDEEIRRRIATQLPASEKLRHATDVIDCSGSLEDTRRQVSALADRLNVMVTRDP